MKRNTVIFIVVIGAVMAAGLFLAVSPYILVYHDPDAIVIGASLNTTIAVTNQTIVVTITETNSLYFGNSVAVASDWRVQNLSLAPCDPGPFGLRIFGVAVFQVEYTLGNISSATPLALNEPGIVFLSCGPASYPPSNPHTVEFGPRQTVEDSVWISGYWTGDDVLHPFQPGAYTIVAGDEWGHVAFLYFRVVGISTVRVNQGAVALAYDPAKGEIFVTNGSDIVSVISDSSDRVVAHVTMAKPPQGLYYDDSESIAYDAAKGEIFVANPADGTVTVISDASDSVVATVNVGGGPWGLAYDSAKGEIFVTNTDNTISVISDQNNSVVMRMPVGRGEQGMAYDPSKGEIFVSTSGASLLSNGSVYVISDSTDKIVANVTVGPAPTALAYDQTKGEIFVANGQSDTVSIISEATDKVVSTTTVGGFVMGLTYDSSNGEVYVSSGRGTISFISDATDNVIGHVGVSEDYGSVSGVVYDSSKGEVFVGGSTGIVYVIPDSV